MVSVQWPTFTALFLQKNPGHGSVENGGSIRMYTFER